MPERAPLNAAALLASSAFQRIHVLNEDGSLGPEFEGDDDQITADMEAATYHAENPDVPLVLVTWLATAVEPYTPDEED